MRSTTPTANTAGRWGCTDGAHLDVAVTRSPGVLCVRLEGEVDFSTLADLGDPLRHLELDVGALVHLDASQLRFADVAAVRLLARFARQAQRTGHDVQTSGAGPTFRKVAAILEVDDDLGLS